MSSAARPLGNAVATAATLHAAVAERLLGGRDHVGVDADGGGRRAGRVGRVGVHRLGGERADLAGGVLALERGQVDHPDRQVDRVRLGRGLDRAGAEGGRAGLGADLVDAGEAVQEPAQRGVVLVMSEKSADAVGARCTRPWPVGMAVVGELVTGPA